MSVQSKTILSQSVQVLDAVSTGAAVGYDGHVVTDQATPTLGFAARPAQAGEMVDVCVCGTQPAIIATTGLTAGTKLSAGANGLVASSGSDVVVGVLLQDASIAGKLSAVLRLPRHIALQSDTVVKPKGAETVIDLLYDAQTGQLQYQGGHTSVYPYFSNAGVFITPLAVGEHITVDFPAPLANFKGALIFLSTESGFINLSVWMQNNQPLMLPLVQVGWQNTTLYNFMATDQRNHSLYVSSIETLSFDLTRTINSLHVVLHSSQNGVALADQTCELVAPWDVSYTNTPWTETTPLNLYVALFGDDDVTPFSINVLRG